MSHYTETNHTKKAKMKIPEDCSYGCINFLYKHYLFELDDKCYELIDELGSNNFKKITNKLDLIKSSLEGLTEYHNLMKLEQNNPKIPEEVIHKEFLRLPMNFIASRKRYVGDKGNELHYYIVNYEKVSGRIGEHIKSIDRDYRDSMALINFAESKKQSTGV